MFLRHQRLASRGRAPAAHGPISTPLRRSPRPYLCRAAASPVLLLILLLPISVSVPALAQSESERIEQLEREVAKLREIIAELQRERVAGEEPPGEKSAEGASRLGELERRIELIAEELERMHLGGAAEEPIESVSGLGIAASRVYGKERGLSIGGYGEALYESFSSQREDGASAGRTDQLDFLRAIVYFGYKFDDRWIFNSEIEVEHASSGRNGEVSVEFAYLDYLWKPAVNARAGLLLAPMGLVNELHEPPLFLSAERPNVERVILPSTWRENGLGLYGDLGPFSYRTYVLNGLRADGFSASGIRGGRQKGSLALAEDFAWVGRLDYTAVPGLLAGVSLYVGDSGQGLRDDAGKVIDATAEILDLHFDWKYRGLQMRGLWARAQIDDVARLNRALGLAGTQSIGTQLDGYYFELGYDVVAHQQRRLQLIPFARFESFDTQGEVPSGFLRDPANDAEVITYGLAIKPREELIFKLDLQDWTTGARSGVDQWNLAMGYLF